MSTSRKKRRPRRQRIGRVSFFEHHGAWYVYYREGSRQIRRRVSASRDEAQRVAAQVNAQLTAATPTLLAFTPISISELRRQFLDHHEQVLRSSLATICRYRSATKYLEDFAQVQGGDKHAHEVQAHAFVRHLRGLLVAPNGHPNSQRRPLRDKGVQYILECCRAMYSFAQCMRHLPPYVSNPFADLRLERLKNEDAKPIFVFDAHTELAFFQAADRWAFPIHFTLAKTGMRPGELVHLLIAEIDLVGGWVHIRGKPFLGWRIKTGRDRVVPLGKELVAVLRYVIGQRAAGLVFRRPWYCDEHNPAGALDLKGLQGIYNQELAARSSRVQHVLARGEQARIAKVLWQNAGLVKVDAIRTSFIRVMSAIGHPEATCPKSWRHSYATLLQDAGVDPLIRQLCARPQASRGRGWRLWA